MSGPSTGPAYECEQCGYELTALAVEGCETRCPECAANYRWPPPLARGPWPGWWRIVLSMCGPTVGLMGFVLVLARFDYGIFTIAFAWPLLLFAWLFAAAGGPAITAAELAKRHVLRPGRNRVRWTLQLAGAAVNLLTTALAVLILIASL